MIILIFLNYKCYIYNTRKNCGYQRYHGFHNIPRKLRYVMYLYPLRVWVQWVRVRFRKIVPTVYPCGTLESTWISEVHQESTRIHGGVKLTVIFGLCFAVAEGPCKTQSTIRLYPCNKIQICFCPLSERNE